MRIYKDPIFIFFCIAVCLFAYEVMNKANNSEAINLSEIEPLLAESFRLRYGREPNGNEKLQLSKQWLDDELLYKEALRLGLDEKDEIVRRRLIQKMYLLFDGYFDHQKIDSNEINDFYLKNANRYKSPDKYTFELIEVSRRHFKTQDYQEAINLQHRIKTGEFEPKQATQSKGYLFIIHENKIPSKIIEEYGEDFFVQLSNAQLSDKANSWEGVVSTPKGWVLFKLLEFSSGSVPDFNMLIHQVKKDYLAEEKERYIAEKIASLREQHVKK